MAKQKLPWGKFYWSDWRGDPALRICSLAARGLWIDMLCIAADASPLGYVLVNGLSPTTPDLARMIGATEQEVETLLSELFKNGVCSKDRHDRIYSRRMVRDEKKAKVSRKNGQLGGNPRLGKQRENQPQDNPSDNSEVNTQRLEARGQSIESKKVSKKEDAPAKEKKVVNRKPETPLPEGWEPGEKGREYARKRWAKHPEYEFDVDDEIEQFRNNHLKKDSHFRDWDAAWRTWVGTAIKYASPANGSKKNEPETNFTRFLRANQGAFTD